MVNVTFVGWTEGTLYRWTDNQSLCCSLKHKSLMTGHNYSTHRKQLFAFPARTTHSALVAGTRWRPLLWTVLVCSIFTLTNYRQATSTTESLKWLCEVIIDVSSEATLKQQRFKAVCLRSTLRLWLEKNGEWINGSSTLLIAAKKKGICSQMSHFFHFINIKVNTF